MANIKSQKKRILTNEKRRVRNKQVRTALKTHIKQFHQALGTGDPEIAAQALRVAGRELDRAASKGVIHRNNAANRKSSLARMLNTRSA
jgi:small subunit ribosomal protein S20